jgi:hypothetical protein
MSTLFGGGGGGSAPTPPKLRQVSTAVGGPLWNTAADFGKTWAANMRSSYGLGQTAGATVGPSWEAKYLGPGALAMQGQAATAEAGGMDPQVQGVLQSGFGAPRGAGASTGSTWNLGVNPYQTAKELGQAPLTQLERNQGFTTALEKQWQPPDLTLTGTDLYDVATQQAAQNAQARQAALAAQIQGSNYAASAQAQAQGAETAAFGNIAAAGIKAFTPTTGYYAPGSTPGGTGGSDYSSPPSDVSPGGGQYTSSFGSPPGGT